MHKSPTSSRATHHGSTSSASMAAAAAAAAAANLPFSIDHILSSTSSIPIKQAAAVHQAMSSFHEHPQQSHLSQQQQQAAAMFMLNQAAVASSHHQPPTSSHQQAVDIMNSAAMLNEQLAMLTAAQQQQQQHLLNPTALAAAQHQLHQHWQQQQLMAAAAAAINQQQQTSSGSSLGALDALGHLNSLASQSHNGNTSNGTPNHLLSCFMASMLLQQQQQQQKQSYQVAPDPQHHLLNQHQQRTSGISASAFLSPLVEQHQSAAAKLAGPNHANQLITAQLNAAAAAAAAANNRLRSPLNTSSSSNSTNSPVKQFFGIDPSAMVNSNNNNFSHNHNNSSSFKKNSPTSEYENSSSSNKRSPLSPTPTQPQQANTMTSKRFSRDSQQRPMFDARQTNEQQPRSNLAPGGQHQSSKPASTKTEHHSNEQETGAGSTALSSLTNFVSNSLAPIFGDDLRQSRGPKRSLSSSNNHQRPLSGNGNHQKGALARQGLDMANNNNNEYSGNESSHEDDKSSLASTRISSNNNSSASRSVGILDAVTSALKGNPATMASTINTTLAKAPPELVQKQPAWVFCTRYSDRPSSGPRTRRAKSKDKKPKDTKLSADEKRPRTAFTSEQLEKLREEFQANSYLDEKRRKSLAERLCLNENQIKIWFQNKRAKMKKQSNQPNPLRGLLVAGGLYNHSTATSDCSESYVNGLADDIGNRAMRDVEPDDGDEPDGEEEEEEAAEDATACLGSEGDANIDRFKHKQQQTRTLKSLSDRSAGGDRQAKTDQDNIGTQQQQQQQVTGDRSTLVETLKRRRTSQSDGDDEDEDNIGRNSTSNSHLGSTVIKRTKLNHTERNHNQRLALSHASLNRLVDGEEEEEEPVISVS